jgi:hypothetical protein
VKTFLCTISKIDTKPDITPTPLIRQFFFLLLLTSRAVDKYELRKERRQIKAE